MLARNVVDSPASSGRARAPASSFCVTSSRRAGSPAPVSRIQNSNPPVVPMPGIAGGATGTTIPSRIFLPSPYTWVSTARAFSARACFAEP